MLGSGAENFNALLFESGGKKHQFVFFISIGRTSKQLCRGLTNTADVFFKRAAVNSKMG